MKNEIEPRREGKVLYEPPEPLFPDLPPRPSKRILRLAAAAMLLIIALAAWGLAVSASEGGNDGWSTSDGKEDESYPQENITFSESDQYTAPTDEITWGETLTEEEPERETEMESENETDDSAETESQAPLPDGVIETDLSLAERGDSYIVNYTDKAVEVSELLDRGFVNVEEKNSPAPLMMILHTHTSEAYYGSENTYLDGVIAVGERICGKLNELGVTAIHCTVIHDGGEGNAYISARDTIETMLRIYPSIKYVVDLHRMELDGDGVPVKTVSAEGLAQIRLTASATSAGWQESLSLALALRQKLNEGGARLCLPPILSPSRYNSDLSEYYLLVDIGSSGNTEREAAMASERLAKAIYDTVITK